MTSTQNDANGHEKGTTVTFVSDTNPASEQIDSHGNMSAAEIAKSQVFWMAFLHIFGEFKGYPRRLDPRVPPLLLYFGNLFPGPGPVKNASKVQNVIFTKIIANARAHAYRNESN